MARWLPRLLMALCLAAETDAQQADMDKVLKQLQAPPGQAAKAVDFVLANSERAPSANLYLSAAAAQSSGRVQDAAFLFYAAQLRARMDLDHYPPKGTGGDSPAVLLGALNQQIGSEVNPAIMRHPKLFSAVVDRVAVWSPVSPKNYDPGWEFTTPTGEAKAQAEFTARRAEFITHFRGLATLLNDPEYFAAFKTLQDYNLGSFEQMQDVKRIRAKEAAEEKMYAIEKNRKIDGFFYTSKPVKPR